MLTEEDKNSIDYFWNEKCDLERWLFWKEKQPILKRECPELLKAWDDYKMSIAVLNAIIRQITSK